MPKPELNDEIEVDENDEVEVEIEASDEQDDNPNIADQLEGADGSENETDKRTPEERYNAFKEQDPEAEEEYGKKVKKRIDELTYKWHEEQRQAKAAIEFAENVRKENERLKEEQTKGQFAFLNSRKGHLTAELEQAKSLYKEAYNANDPDLIAEANQNISKFASELSQIDNTINRIKNNPALRKQNENNQESQSGYTSSTQTSYTPPQQTTQQPTQQQKVEPDEKAQAWAEKNEWFGEDEELTQSALTIHRQLVSNDGYLPSSEAYYEELDNRLRKNFPSKFKVAQTSSSRTNGNGSQVVAPGSSQSLGKTIRNKNRVKLTASQVAIAKKLGVPLEEYAKYV